MTLRLEWLKRPGYVDGGCWVLVKGNGQLFVEPAQKGKSPATRAQLEHLGMLWNLGRQ